MEWSIRSLLNPVITRCLIYGVNPIDMEYVLKQVEKKPLVNSRALEMTWREEWEKKARRFSDFGKEAKKEGNLKSAYEYFTMAARCYYACYLINSEQIAIKREVYKKLESYYLEALKCSKEEFEKVVIKVSEKKGMPAYLHFPDAKEYKAPYPCVTIFAGMGSCKEELETMARPLVERGIAVLTLDMPGTGAALFDYDFKLNGPNLEAAFERIENMLTKHEKIDETRLGTYGLCMGGGYAYRFGAKYKSVKAVANLFPLFITMLEDKAIPRWMKDGVWASYQVQDDETGSFMDGMNVLTQGTLEADYFICHSSYDNWMPLDKTKVIIDKTEGKTEVIKIDEEPAYATKESVMHAMPVGEQMHWIKLKIADWFKREL